MNQVSKYSIQVLSFAVVILIVALVSSYFTASHKDKKQKKVIEQYYKMLQKEEKYAQEKIHNLHQEIQKLEQLKRADSLSIVGLRYRIQQDGVRLEKERVKASKMNSDEKKTYLLNRYSSN